MNEKICSMGHVIAENEEVCARCGGPAQNNEVIEDTVDEVVEVENVEVVENIQEETVVEPEVENEVVEEEKVEGEVVETLKKWLMKL